MSVVTRTQYTREPFQGSGIAGEPIGIWTWSDRAVGNASGGVRQLGIIFREVLATAPQSSLMYSLESLYLSDSDNNSKQCDMLWSNLGFATAFVRRMVISVVIGQTYASMIGRDLAGFRGMVLGSQQAQSNRAELQFVVANVNGEDWIGNAHGYIWDGSSLSVKGGPVRPQRGLYTQ